MKIHTNINTYIHTCIENIFKIYKTKLLGFFPPQASPLKPHFGVLSFVLLPKWLLPNHTYPLSCLLSSFLPEGKN